MRLNFGCSTCLRLLLAFCGAGHLFAQAERVDCHQSGHHRYVLVDLGTLGGPTSHQLAGLQLLNNRGTLIAFGDLAAPDPYAPNCLQNCFLSHAMKWENGVTTDLGALPGVNDSLAFGISANGLIAGLSEDGVIDPLTNFPEVEPVLWERDGRIVDLGSLGGNEGQAFSVNTRGQVVGVALNATPDAYAPFFYLLPAATQARAFLWERGAMQDLGTLGGPDAGAFTVNERGQIGGMSFTNSTANATTGIPTVHPFLWENGHMLDIGSLGGTLSVLGVVCCGNGTPGLNNRGQISGTSTLAGDKVQHAFFWERGVLRDLGTLGGANSQEFYLTETGEVVGRADFSPSSTDHHAFSWKDGVMTDLGTLGTWPCSTSYGANSREQVVGDTGICNVGGGPPFLSEHGERMVDLNTLVLPGSDLTLDAASFINERGEIAGDALLPNGDTRAILLIPCDRDHADFEGCKGHVDEVVTDDMLAAAAAAPTRLTKGSVNHESRVWARQVSQLP